MQVAHAIATGLLPRDSLPAALLAALRRVIAFYEAQDDSAGEDSYEIPRPQAPVPAPRAVLE